jgi:hypothetical protein
MTIFVSIFLSLIIFCLESWQRGLVTLSKSPMLPIFFTSATSMYFIVVASSIFVMGLVLDNTNAKKSILVGIVLGMLGIILTPYTIYGYGLIFGISASLMKLIPFSSPLKISSGKYDGLLVAPQASAKNFGGAFGLLVLVIIMKSFGLLSTSIFIAIIFGISGFAAYFLMPDIKVEGWKISIFKELAVDWKFWLMMVYFFFMSGIFYLTIASFIPALKRIEHFSDGQAAFMIGISYIATGIFRFGAAWLGDKIGHLVLMLTGTLGMIYCYFLLKYDPFWAVWIFSIFSTMHTANYWAQCKQLWGPKYIATILGLGYVAMYIGAGVLYGKWAI